MPALAEGAMDPQFPNLWCGGGVEQRSGHLVRLADKLQSSLGWHGLRCQQFAEERHRTENLRYNFRKLAHPFWMAKSGDPCWILHLVINSAKEWLVPFGRVTSKTGLIGKGSLGRSGYYFTSVTCTPVPTRVVAVHRLVAFAFLGPPPCVHLTQVNHKDLDKGNNSADNLEWVSPAENLSHFHANNMFKRRNGKTVLTRVHGSTGVWKWHCSIQSAARATGTNRWNIWKCCNGRSLQTRGHEFKHADIDEAKSLPGEEWREVDIKVLRDDRIARRGQVWYMRSIALKWRSDGSQVSSSFDTQKESQIVDGWQKSRWC